MDKSVLDEMNKKDYKIYLLGILTMEIDALINIKILSYDEYLSKKQLKEMEKYDIL